MFSPSQAQKEKLPLRKPVLEQLAIELKLSDLNPWQQVLSIAKKLSSCGLNWKMTISVGELSAFPLQCSPINSLLFWMGFGCRARWNRTHGLSGHGGGHAPLWPVFQSGSLQLASRSPAKIFSHIEQRSNQATGSQVQRIARLSEIMLKLSEVK